MNNLQRTELVQTILHSEFHSDHTSSHFWKCDRNIGLNQLHFKYHTACRNRPHTWAALIPLIMAMCSLSLPLWQTLCLLGVSMTRHLLPTLSMLFMLKPCIGNWTLSRFPMGKQKQSFVSELARLFKAFATRSTLESIALKAATLMPIPILQKPTCKSKAKDHITCLERRLGTWWEGDLDELLREGRSIQVRTPKS